MGYGGMILIAMTITHVAWKLPEFSSRMCSFEKLTKPLRVSTLFPLYPCTTLVESRWPKCHKKKNQDRTDGWTDLNKCIGVSKKWSDPLIISGSSLTAAKMELGISSGRKNQRLDRAHSLCNPYKKVLFCIEWIKSVDWNITSLFIHYSMRRAKAGLT